MSHDEKKRGAKGRGGAAPDAGALARALDTKRRKKEAERALIVSVRAKVLALVAPGPASLSRILEIVGISDSQFSRWKVGTGKLSAFAAFELARYLDVDLEWLVDPEMTMPPRPGLRRIEGALKRALAGRIGVEAAYELALRVAEEARREAEGPAAGEPAGPGTPGRPVATQQVRHPRPGMAAPGGPEKGKGGPPSKEDPDRLDEPRRQPKRRPR